jgi:acetylornithine deacetylase
LSTHFDCVPPFFPSREENGMLYGRGACDAKGILAAQLAAAERLRVAGENRVGLLFVVGEERGSDGAKAANQLAQESEYLVNGEPTDGRLGLATRGVIRLRLKAHGRASHSSYQQAGESAIEKLLEALATLRNLQLPEDPLLGRTHYNVGLISGGVAPNVVPPEAEAEILFRTVGDAGELRQVLRSLTPLVEIEELLEMPPVRMHEVEGFKTAVFPYTTDLPFLDCWGKPLLYGPGSIKVAHSADEHVNISHLRDAVDGYITLTTKLLANSS